MFKTFIAVAALLVVALADHPVHCVTSDFLGSWTFSVEEGDGAFYDCAEELNPTATVQITFERDAVCSVDGDSDCWWTVMYVFFYPNYNPAAKNCNFSDVPKTELLSQLCPRSQLCSWALFGQLGGRFMFLAMNEL